MNSFFSGEAARLSDSIIINQGSSHCDGIEWLFMNVYRWKHWRDFMDYRLSPHTMFCRDGPEAVVHVEQRSLLAGDVTVCVAVWMFLQGNLSELGKLLMQGSFNVWTDHKKGHNKVQLLHANITRKRH